MGFLDDVGNFASDAVNTAEDVGSSAVDDVKNVASGAANDVSDAAQTVWNNATDAIENVAEGAINAAKGAGDDLLEAFQTFGHGFDDLAHGRIADAFGDWGSGLFHGLVETPVDAALMFSAHAVAGIQSAVGAEPTHRKLTDAEIAELKKVYGDSIDYSKIEIVEGDNAMTVGNNARTIGNTIYLPEGWNKDGKNMKLLVHESCHVWQYEHGGDDYMSEALWGQAFGEGYNYQKGIDEGKSWPDLNPEQQADLIKNAYDSGYFTTGVWMTNGTPNDQLTKYMNEVMPQLTAGSGAT